MVCRALSRTLPVALGYLIIFTASNTRAEALPPNAAPSTAHAPEPTLAGPDAEEKSRAASLFDEGTALYARAEYARAAEAFLRADAVVPSTEALESAIAAARKEQAHLLVVRASERAISRESQDPALAARARAALVEAERHLARLEVSCAPSPCVVFLDGQPLDETRLHLVPGAYRLSAQQGVSRELVASGAFAERFTALAGAEYRFALDAPRGATALAPTTPEPAMRNSALQDRDERVGAQPGLPPWVFYGAVGGSGVLTLVTTWSGIDALSQRDALPSRDAEGYAVARSDLTYAAGRTDVLLAASVVFAAGTAALGLWWTAWEQEQAVEVGGSPLLQGAELRLRGRFH